MWSELQRISKRSNASVISTTFSELDVQHNYLFQLISNKRQPTKSEFQSILRIILFPSRRLLRHIDENYSLLCLNKKKSENLATIKETSMDTLPYNIKLEDYLNQLKNIDHSNNLNSTIDNSSDITSFYGKYN